MFTGLVEGVRLVRSIQERQGGRRLQIDLGPLTEGVRTGDSIALNGVCLTAVALKNKVVDFDAIVETLRVTNLGELKAGSVVNVERSLCADGRIGGHFVQGHIDGTAVIQSIQDEGESRLFTFEATPELTTSMIKKGSIAIDGISLTLTEVSEDTFSVAIIPHTLQITTLGRSNRGDKVNVETDMIGKYIVKLYNERNHTRM